METGTLFLKNLRKTYGNKTAVNIASLEIQPRTFTCIVGKSGCGKTTLLRLLAGLETPDSDTDKKANDSGSDSTISNRSNFANATNKNTTSCITGLPAKTAPVFQEPRLMPWLTVKENIMFSLKGKAEAVIKKQENDTTSAKTNQRHNNRTSNLSATSEERCQQLLDKLELSEAANLYSSQLSGGMAQRVSLGRTLFYDPDLILMDEPFSALDYFTRRNLQDMVLRLFQHQKKTILFVTHDVEEALLLGDRILVMENGSIKADMPVSLPFPRQAADPALQEMRQQILNLLSDN